MLLCSWLLSHTFLKGGKSPSDMEFLFGRVSSIFTKTLLSLEHETQSKILKKKDLPNRRFHFSLIIQRLCNTSHTFALIRACQGGCYRGIRLHGGMEVPVNTSLGRDLTRPCLEQPSVLGPQEFEGGGINQKLVSEHTHTTVYKIYNWGFPGGPVARTPDSDTGGQGSIPRSGN